MSRSNALEFHLGDIDGQHERLFELQRSARLSLQNETDPARIRTELGGLRMYAKLHFDVEESFFSESGYPDAEVHRREHQVFLGQMDALIEDCGGDGQTVCARFDAAGVWLQRHILEQDMQYVEFLRLTGDHRDRLQAFGSHEEGVTKASARTP